MGKERVIKINQLKQQDSFMVDGNITKVILTISTPLMINNFVRTVYNLTDGLFVAQLSPMDFAATAFVWPLNYMFIAVGLGLGVGATSLISQYLGAKQDLKVRLYSANALILSIVLGFFLATIGYFSSETMISWMGAEGVLLEKSTIYLKVSFIGLFFDFIFFAYQAILTAQGMTKSITLVSVISSLTNVILDPIFIFDKVPLFKFPGLGLGLSGAAWATIISKIVLLICTFYIIKKDSEINVKLRLKYWDSKIAKTIMKISLPSSLGNGGSALGFTMLNSLIQSYGTETLTAFSMINRITDLFTQPQMGIGNALTSIIGRNMGAKKYDRVKDIFKKAIQIVTIVSLIASIITIVFRYPLLRIFIKDNSNQLLWAESLEYLYYSAVIIFFMGFFSALNGFFQGVGKTRYSMNMEAGRLWIFRLPLIWIFGAFTDIGSTGVWLSMAISNLLICVYGFYIYYSRDWYSIVED